MTTSAVIFMVASWTFVLGLMGWCFARILRQNRRFHSDGIGPATPPKPASTDPS